MRKHTLVALICISFAFTAYAQEGPKVMKVDPQMSDIYNVFDVLNIHLSRFDLKAFLTDVYFVNVYVDEYVKGKDVKRVNTTRVGKNITSLNEVPEKYRDDFRKLKNIPAGKNEWDNIKELSLYVTKPNDSTARFSINIPDAMSTSQQVKLRSVGEPKMYFYKPVPFSFKAMEKQETMSIPLLLYGSAWEDTKNGIVRFCGESEIDPGMKAEILSDIPHYYIIGVELKKE